jgi:Rps23 Pro-64 3,4-dihydroxylase Tpa1-like proline 4-hydroxylase
MNYTINNNFCDKTEANSIIDFCIKYGEPFSYQPNEVWDCRRIYDESFKTKILNKLINYYKNGEFKLWFDYNHFNVKNFNISLTSYYDGRFLNLHKDKVSELTTVIVLSDGFDGGQFAISDNINPSINFENLNGIKTFDLKLGDSISFNGSNVYHGVLPVTKNIRYALNIWMTESDYDYPPTKINKTLI